IAPLRVMLDAGQPPHAPSICTNAVPFSTLMSHTSPPSIWMPGRTLSSAAFTRSSTVALLSIAFHEFVHAARDAERVVPIALPHVASEDEAHAARFHCNLRFVNRIFVAHFAAARNEHQRASSGLDDLSQSI